MHNPQETYRPLLSDFVSQAKAAFKDNLVSMVLYGSVATGRARKDSDIDILIICKVLPESRHKRTLLIFPIIKALRDKESYKFLYREGYLPEISPLLYTVDEIRDTKPVFLDMVEDGVILLDDGTWERKRQELAERMKELGTHKVQLPNNEYYWVLKPGLHLAEEVAI